MYFENRSVVSDIHLPEKNNLNTPRPITDDGIRKTLKRQHVKLKKLRVPPKDEKILKLMVDKGTWEKDYWKGRLERSLAWDTEKLNTDNLKLEQFKNHRTKMEVTREEDRQKVLMDKLEKQRKHFEKKAALLKQLEKNYEEHDKQVEEQAKLKEEKLKKLVEKEEELKSQQEKNWWEVNSKEFEKRIQEKIEHDKKRLLAEEKREEHIKEEIQRVIKENETERLYYTERYVCLEKKQKKNQKSLTVKIERKLKKASENFETVTKEKLKAIELDAKNEEEKIQKAFVTQSKLEHEHQTRAKKMFEKTQEDIEKANAALEKSIQDMTKEIRVDRETKEKMQKTNLKKVKKELRKWRKKTEKEIKREEKKMKEKQEERQRILGKTRSVAAGSRVLRDKVLDAIGAENFDRKLFRVERFRDLGSRTTLNELHTASINMLLV